MKRAAVVLICLSLLACSSSSGGQKVRIPEPDIEFVQLIGPADQNYPGGNIEVQYGMRIANRSADPITLMRIEMRSVGGGGPYELRPRAYHFKETVGPDQFRDVAWWARAYAGGDAFANDATQPVSVRAVAYFETPHGMIRKIVMRNFTQFGNDGARGPR